MEFWFFWGRGLCYLCGDLEGLGALVVVFEVLCPGVVVFLGALGDEGFFFLGDYLAYVEVLAALGHVVHHLLEEFGLFLDVDA